MTDTVVDLQKNPYDMEISQSNPSNYSFALKKEVQVLSQNKKKHPFYNHPTLENDSNKSEDMDKDLCPDLRLRKSSISEKQSISGQIFRSGSQKSLLGLKQIKTENRGTSILKTIGESAKQF